VVAVEATLRTAPNRFNALSGAAHAAMLSGDTDKAKGYLHQAAGHLRPCRRRSVRDSRHPVALGPEMSACSRVTADQ